MFGLYTDPYGLDRLVNGFVKERWNEMTTERSKTLFPPVDIFDSESEVVLTLELPGVCKDDLEIGIEDMTLTVTAEKKGDSQGDEKQCYHLREREFGSFSRTFTLGEDHDTENIAAELINGVLKVVIPKMEPPVPEKKVIPIN